MLLWIILKVGLKSLWANKMRSILAMLGIIIGVAAVISMLALGAGAEKQLLANFAKMGTNLLMISPGQRGMGGVVTGVQQNLTVEDALAIPGAVPGVRVVAPVVNQSAQVKYGNKNMRCSVIGSTVSYLPIRNFEIDKGRCFTDGQVDANMRLAVLGSATVEQLFGVNDPLGEIVKVNGINFTVVGVTKPKGSQGWFNPDEVVIVPYNVAMRQLFGLKNLREIDVQAEEGYDNAVLKDDLAAFMRKRHKVTVDDVTVTSQAEMIQMASAATDLFKALLFGIATVSLLVGGIGIMNIMLVTVTERTREIGIRKAVGAKERHILWQFLAESVIISGLGGLLGVAFGVGGALILPRVMPANMPLQTVLSTGSIFLSLSFAAFVGIFFGLYPAWRAARLDPVEALRYE